MAEVDSMVRVGIVSSVNETNMTARVYYPDMSNMVSDWLKVIQYQHPYTTYDGEHSHTDSAGGATSTAGSHRHKVEPWLPEINDKVVVLMSYGFNSTGYILGVIP